jgi:hypothetical protein
MTNPYSKHRCGSCGAHGVKLWRPYGSFYRYDRCTLCAEREQGKKRRGTEIGWLVPLILDDNDEVWGYTSCPQKDIDRWEALPDAVEVAL